MMIYTFPKLPMIVFLTLALLAASAFSQASSEVAVFSHTPHQGSPCVPLKTGIVRESDFDTVKNNRNCPGEKLPTVDFAKHTLIFYTVRGDCFMRVSLRSVTRNNEKKTLRVELDNLWGRCRAGGAASGFIAVDKIPDDFELEFIENKIDGKDSGQLRLSNERIEMSGIDLKGCMNPVFGRNEIVLKSAEDYLKYARNNTAPENCTKRISSLDFDKFIYAGVIVRSGYCGTPLGLRHWAFKDKNENTVVIRIRYTDPKGSVCRALSRYEL
ncbi:MAG: hypothetical protein KDB79_16660, partial [Acidobacteria bacterium]|nr:hypothetical protein [Acidobacteriota bacterium]